MTICPLKKIPVEIKVLSTFDFQQGFFCLLICDLVKNIYIKSSEKYTYISAYFRKRVEKLSGYLYNQYNNNRNGRKKWKK